MRQILGTSEAVITYKPIGVIRSERRAAEKTPFQPTYAKGCKGRVEIFPEFAKGLQDLDGFSHVYLIYHFHQSRSVRLTVKHDRIETTRNGWQDEVDEATAQRCGRRGYEG